MIEHEVRHWIAGYLAEYLELPLGRVTAVASFQSFGMDSVDAIVIAGALEDRFDVEVDATLFLRCRNLDEVVVALRTERLLP